MPHVPFFRALASTAALLMLGACATTSASPVEVTRFVGEAPAQLGRGAIAVRSGTGAAAGLRQQAAEAAVAEELRQIGYTIVPGQAEQVAEVWFDELPIGSARSRSPVSVGVGGSTGTYGSGVGVGVGINLGGSQRPSLAGELRVRIRAAGDGPALWEGRADASAGGRNAAQGVSPARLAAALFDGFPGRSGETIAVP